MEKIFHTVVTVSITTGSDSEYFYNLHGNITYQYKYNKKKSLDLVLFLLHTLLEYIFFDKSGSIKMTHSC